MSIAPDPATTKWVPLQGTRLDGVTYWGSYEASRTYNDGDCAIASDGVLYMCVKDGTIGTAPVKWPDRTASQGPKGDPGIQGVQGDPIPTPIVNGRWIKGVGGVATWTPLVATDIPGLVIADTAWINMSLYGGAYNYGSGYPVGRYRKDAAGMVHVSGLIMVPAGNIQYCTLPVGYRPSAILHVPVVMGGGTMSYMHIYPSGVLQSNITSATWISVDHTNFLAEQ